MNHVSAKLRSIQSLLVTDLRLDIEDAPPARIRHVLDGHEASPIKVAGELSMFDERVVRDHFPELFVSHEVVVFSICLSWSR